MSDRCLVVGSGISGLSAAVLLARAGLPVEMWEQESESGGMLAPVSFQGVACDRGSHRVHPESHPLLRSLTEAEDWRTRNRDGRLVLSGRTVSYPPDPAAFVRGLGARATWSMGVGWLTRPGTFRAFRQWEDDRSAGWDDDEGFEAFVIRRVGRSAYERFYKPYVDKVWGIDPAEVSQTVAKQRVSTSNPLQTFRRALARGGGRDRQFLYPRDGMHALIRRLGLLADELGVIRRSDRRFGVDAESASWRAVLYSGRLADLAPTAGLAHRGLYLLHLAVPRGCLPPHDTWYLPGPEFWFGRVSQPSRFSGHLQAEDSDVLCVEIPEGRWGQGVDFVGRMSTLEQQLRSAGILPQDVKVVDAKQTFVPHVYPMYVRGWLGRWRSALEAVVARGPILPIGRQGLFLHCNMDHCVYIADEAVRHLTAGGTAAAWVDRCTDFLDLRVRD